MKKSSREHPIESPIPFRAGSNGEFEPPAPTRRDRAADELFHRVAAEKARRIQISRRDFVSSTMGTATALFVINEVYGCTSEAGFNIDAGTVPGKDPLDTEEAAATREIVNRILWGTDSIWYGSPQDQISAFRVFEIPQSMQDSYGYPALTTEARAKILGLTAADLYGIDVQATRCAIAEDDFARAKHAMQADPSRSAPAFTGTEDCRDGAPVGGMASEELDLREGLEGWFGPVERVEVDARRPLGQ